MSFNTQMGCFQTARKQSGAVDGTHQTHQTLTLIQRFTAEFQHEHLRRVRVATPPAHNTNIMQENVSGSGVAVAVATVVSVEKLLTVVVPCKFTFTVNAHPSVISLVKTGVVPSASENMLKADVLPDVDTPSGDSEPVHKGSRQRTALSRT
jgi:hypothetical protein